MGGVPTRRTRKSSKSAVYIKLNIHIKAHVNSANMNNNTLTADSAAIEIQKTFTKKHAKLNSYFSEKVKFY